MANRRFHRALYAQNENGLVVATLDGLQDLTALATIGVLWENWPTWRTECDEHQEILRAALDADAERAELLMRAHIERSIARLRSTQDTDAHQLSALSRSGTPRGSAGRAGRCRAAGGRPRSG